MRQGNPHITAVIFDLDNTLIDRDEGFIRFCQEIYHTSGVMADTHTEDEALDLMRSFDENGTRSRQAFFTDVIRTWPGVFENVEQALSVYVVSYPRMMVLDASTRFLLEDLQENSIPCGIVSNGGATMQMAKVQETGIAGLIEHIVISEAVGMRKPDRRIFEHALSLLEANPLTTIFVGDNPEADILGANAVGMRTAWIHRGRKWPYEEQYPDYILNHVSEVRGIVLI